MKMKSALLWIVLASTLILASCRSQTGFSLDLQATVEITPVTMLDTPYEFTSLAEATYSAELFETYDTREKLLTNALPYAVSVESINPNATSNFLKTIEVYIKGEGLEPLILGRMTQIPDGTLRYPLYLDLIPSDAKDHISKASFQVIVKMTADQPMNSNDTYWINLGFNVEAKTMRF